MLDGACILQGACGQFLGRCGNILRHRLDPVNHVSETIHHLLEVIGQFSNLISLEAFHAKRQIPANDFGRLAHTADRLDH